MVTLKQITNYLKAGNGTEEIVEGVSALKEYKKNTITFNKDGLYFNGTRFFDTDKPKQPMIQIINEFFPPKPCDIKIGKNVTIEKGAVLGGDGFNYVYGKHGYEHFPHVGGLVIEDNVSIGSNTVIHRGVLSDTIIGEGTKIDSLCHIAHNAIIGKHCLIIANSVVSGSCVIGDNTRLAMGAIIRNNVTVGKNCVIGMGSVVTKDVPDNETFAGIPAKSIVKKILDFIKK